MSKTHNNSYEGFRRKNSLNSHQPNKNNTSIEIFNGKIKKEDLKLVENLQMQLQNISKRSLTSRSFGQNSMHHTKSCQSITFCNEQMLEGKNFNKQKKDVSSMKKLTFDFEDEQMEFSQLKNEKLGNNMGFNQFDVIQETRSFCQEQLVEDISPVTLKNSLHVPLNQKNKLLNKPLKVTATPRTINKKPTTTKNEITKKEKITHDLSELDKMQKQLQTKKVNKDSFGVKLLSSSTGAHRPKQALNIQGLKDSTKIKPLTNKDVKNETLKSNKQKSSKNILPSPRILQTRPVALVMLKTEEVSQQQMVATRMLSEKEKSNLVNRLLQLRQVIQKNEICSDSNDQIVFHLNSIQKLLTH